ncbi:MAG: ATP-binding protein [Romboutsia sp.]|uniref:ATP-binding protein n=1 Tax=Romboutsia sp. TaxID=1965302 RepID=UPI003F35F72A
MIDSKVLSIILECLNIIAICLAFKYIMNKQKEIAKNRLFSNILLILITSSLLLISILNSSKSVLGYPFYLIGILSIYSKIIYNTNWFDSVMYTSIYIYMYKVVNHIIFWIVIKINIRQYNYVLIEIESFIATTIILIIFVKLVDKVKNINSNRVYYIFISIVILGNILTTMFSFMVGKSTFYSMNKTLNNIGNILNTMLPWIMIICNILLILIVKKIIKDAKIKADNEIIKEKIEMQYKYYLGLQESQEKVKRLYHDINNHMICMKSIYKNKEIADEYINSVNEEIKDFNNRPDTGNVILDIVLNEKKSICDRKNISLYCDINFSKCDFIEMIDVCSIFSNILDNAIEASDKINDSEIEKSINIRGAIVKRHFIIKCENNKINKIKINKDKVVTSKRDKYLHGIGLESVKKSLEKYNGNLEIEDLENKFIVKLYIPIQTKHDSYAN